VHARNTNPLAIVNYSNSGQCSGQADPKDAPCPVEFDLTQPSSRLMGGKMSRRPTKSEMDESVLGIVRLY
jgi:hypothetical protein